MGLFESVKSINWEHESFPTYQDFVLLPLFAVFFPSIRLLFDKFLLEKLGRLLIYGRHNPNMKDMKKKSLTVKKFKESAWKCIYYVSAELLALLVTYNEPWFTNTLYFWIGPGDQIWPNQQLKFKLKFLFMSAAGFYTYSTFALVFWETRRSDFGVMMSHHIVTLILIVLSYICRFFRVGSIILALHDASDVFLEVGKMSKYSGADLIASFSFILFALSWVVLRLIYYPFWILWSTSYQVIMTVDSDPIYYYMFNTLLFTLLVFHIYWWVLIYRGIVKQAQTRGKLVEDTRSDSESEGEHED